MPTRRPPLSFRPEASKRASRSDDSHGFYSLAPWRKLRDRFLKANPLCVRCLEERDELVPSTVAHHKLERLDRPDLALDEGNLEALCGPCHSRHHGGPKG